GVAQGAIHHFERVFGAVHGEEYAGGKNRIEKCPGIADHDPASTAHARAGVGIIAGDAHLRYRLRVRQSRLRVGDHGQRLGEERAVVGTAARLEILRLAHATDAHLAAWQRNEPGPAVLEAVDADDVA